MPHLIVLRGPIGAGKSSIMKEVHDLLPGSSVVEIDTIKRMIDPTGSSARRRRTALNTSVYLTRSLLEHGRSVITETHTRWQDQALRFKTLAATMADVVFTSFLVTTPYSVCNDREKRRYVPDITSHRIDEPMVNSYYVSLEPLQDEPVPDTSPLSAQAAGRFIIQSLEPKPVEEV